MKRTIGALLSTLLVLALGARARAEGEQDAKAIVDKGIKALGGEEKLAQLKAATWKSKGTVNLGGSDSPFTAEGTMQGLDKYRGQFEGEFMGSKIQGVVVLNGDKGWAKFGEMDVELDKDRLANEKHNMHLQLIFMLLLPLKDKAFKVEVAGEDKVGGKPALGLKVTPPDGKEFKLYFDTDSGLPVKVVAKVKDYMGQEHDQETLLTDYKDFQGIKKATKIQSNRNGQKFLEQQTTEFKILDKVDPKTFAEPK